MAAKGRLRPEIWSDPDADAGIHDNGLRDRIQMANAIQPVEANGTSSVRISVPNEYPLLKAALSTRAAGGNDRVADV